MVRMVVVMAAAFLLSGITEAQKKQEPAACPAGFQPSTKGWCYQVARIEAVAVMDTTMVHVILRAPKTVDGAMFNLALYEGGKPVCTGLLTVQGAEKGEDTPAKGMCNATVRKPERVVLTFSDSY